MLQFEELKIQLDKLAPSLENLHAALQVEKKKEEITALEEQTTAGGFWNDSNTSQIILQKLSRLKQSVERYNKLAEKYEDTCIMLELSAEESDVSLLDSISEDAQSVSEELDALTLSTLLTGEYDKNSAILTLHAGAGGTEAQDWVEMLHRMYVRWSEDHGFKVSTLDYLDGDEAGLKSLTMLVEGNNVYGYLKGEMGVHRLVRVSPFDSSGRRHTSFASLEVIPQIEDEDEVEISSDDLRVDTYRASGAGGQHVNKTSSAVRLTHIPTGIVVSCQAGRSQHQNRDIAMRMLLSKLIEVREREHVERIEDIKGNQKEIAWGSQIRSYVFMPYTMVKDHRTNHEAGNIDAVMDGEIDGFIYSYLKDQASKKI